MSLVGEIFGSFFDNPHGPFPNPAVKMAEAIANKPEVVQRVTVQSLIDKKTGVIRIGGKCYKFKFTEVEITR